ncbi:MAG: hypothetical protein ACFE96_02040 [Candidatus Hermodarchaeota archaeon]
MCYYITATLPKEADLLSLKPVFEKHKMSFTSVMNEKVLAQLRPGELYFRATKKYCDCDTILGSQTRPQEYENLLKSKKVKTLRKKNWSEQQIEAWIMEKIAKKPHKKGLKKTSREIEEEINNWINFVNVILNTNKRIGILKHWYNSSLISEDIRIKKTEQINLKDLTEEKLLNLEEDVLYEFFPSYSY